MSSIWVNGARNILSYVKKSLLDYIDALSGQSDPKTREALGKVKGRVHNDISQATFSVGTLIATLESGGDITPFQEELSRKEDRKDNGGANHQPFKGLKSKIGGKDAAESPDRNQKSGKNTGIPKRGT